MTLWDTTIRAAEPSQIQAAEEPTSAYMNLSLKVQEPTDLQHQFLDDGAHHSLPYSVQEGPVQLSVPVPCSDDEAVRYLPQIGGGERQEDGQGLDRRREDHKSIALPLRGYEQHCKAIFTPAVRKGRV